MRHSSLGIRNGKARNGATTVELAIVLPVLFLFTFAGIEFARANQLRNTAENAAYEGARRGIVPGATASECETAAQDMLDLVGVPSATVTVQPDPFLDTTDEVTVTVQIPMTAANGYMTPGFFLGKTLTASITVQREMD